MQNMNIFRRDGAYLKLYDKNKEGYETSGRNGKFIKHKYGFLDKLYDICNSGKTLDTGYKYVYFYISRLDNASRLKLFKGTIMGEFTEVLASIKRNGHYGSHHLINEFIIVNEDVIKYYDKSNRECYLTVYREGNLLVHDYFDIHTNEPKETEYKFYTFI